MKPPRNPRRRSLLLAGAGAALLPHAPLRAQSAFTATVALALDRLGGEVNPYVLGNNVEWVDGGNLLMLPNSLEFYPTMLQAALGSTPTMLRYPGGSHADLYHWQDGIGPLANRRQNEHFFTKQRQTVRMGTQEMLEVCEMAGAWPLFTANAITGTPQEAAAWVRYVNGGLTSRRTGKPLAKVQWWEVGNEPYLKEDIRPETWISPANFASRASAMITAMKAADSSIKVGIPLRSDRLGGTPATPWQGYNDTVLRGVTPQFDFVALHNCYLPFGYDRTYASQEYFLAAMAATRVVDADFAATRAQLAAIRPGRYFPLTVTEHNTIFSLGRGATDAYTTTLAEALYLADLLRLFSQTPDLAIANFWSLNGNGYFGAVDTNAQPRPAYHVLRLFRTLLQGRTLPATVSTRTFANPRVGFTPAMSGTPTVSAHATRDGAVVRTVVINKDIGASATVNLAFPRGGRPVSANVFFLAGSSPFATQLTWTQAAVNVGTDSVSFQQPRHSMAYVELRLPA